MRNVAIYGVEKLHHQESVLDKKLRKEVSMKEENERGREKEWHGN